MSNGIESLESPRQYGDPTGRRLVGVRSTRRCGTTWTVVLLVTIGVAGGSAEAQEVPGEFAVEGGLVLTLWDRWDHIWSDEELSGLSEDVVFGATARSLQGGVLAELMVTHYANPAVTQRMMESLDESEPAVVDSAMWLFVQSKAASYRVVEWVGTRAETHNGVHQVVSPYVRRSVLDGSVTAHHLIRIFNAENSYEITVSHPMAAGPNAQMMQERLVRDVMRNLELRPLEPGPPPW